KLRMVKTRVNQYVFREIVLANYSCKCAMSGINVPELLVASHILPWSKDEKERLNPENGICLSPLYDKAYDQGLIGITPQYEIRISASLLKNEQENYFQEFFTPLNRKKLTLPTRYQPNKRFLEYHMDLIFKK
ncbi:MAG TPA: HNH endonuclease, partial [Chitinophagaceae bacterium]